MIAIAAFFLATGPQTIGQRILLAVLCLVFALLSAYATLDLFRRRIVLNPDGIDSCCLFSVRKLARSEIAGRRILSSYLQITPLNKTAKKLYIPKGLTSDEHFDAWFADIPNLDFVEQSHSVDQLISDQRFGLTEEQRRETFIRAHSIAAWVNRAAFFATL